MFINANIHTQKYYVKGKTLYRRCPDDERGDNIEAIFTSTDLAQVILQLIEDAQKKLSDKQQPADGGN